MVSFPHSWVGAIAEGARRPTWLGMSARYCYRSMVVNHLGPILVGHPRIIMITIKSNPGEMPDINHLVGKR